jgi:hypothetical protein
MRVGDERFSPSWFAIGKDHESGIEGVFAALYVITGEHLQVAPERLRKRLAADHIVSCHGKESLVDIHRIGASTKFATAHGIVANALDQAICCRRACGLRPGPPR